MTRSLVGMNLAPVVNYSTELPFLDFFKQNAGWGCDGKTSAVTFDIPSSTVTWPGHGLSAGCATQYTSSLSQFPDGFGQFGHQSASSAVVYVINPTTNTLQISFTPGGPAITFGGTQGGTFTGTAGLRENLQLDANGWPTSMTLAHGAGTATTIGVFITPSAVNLPDGSAPFSQGTYVLLYQGTGTVVVSGGNISHTGNGGVGREIYNCNGTGSIALNITAITSGPIKVQFVYSPGSTTGGAVGTNEQLLLNGELINPLFASFIQPFPAYRFMDWMKILYNPVSAWADRTPVGYYSWGLNPTDGGYLVSPGSTPRGSSAANFGVPYEAIIALCNETNSDCWVCVPFEASDAYVTSLANLFSSTLNSNLKVYAEYGNEFFNGGAWMPYINEYLSAQVTATSTGSIPNFGVVRAVQVMELWKAVFGNPSSRLVRVLGGGLGITGNNIVQMELTDATYYAGQACTHFDAYTISHYFPNIFSFPLAWSGDADPNLKVIGQLTVGGFLPTGVSSTTTTGGPSAFTVSPGLGLSNPPPNGTVVCINLNQNANADATLVLDGGTPIVMKNVDGSSTPNYGAGVQNVCFTSVTRDGPVSPGQWRPCSLGLHNQSAGGEIASTVAYFSDSATAALAHGMYVVSYEGGLNWVPLSVGNLQTYTDWLAGASRDVRMGYVYTLLYTSLRPLGKLFLHFNDAGVATNAGLWGAIDGILQSPATAPRLQALLNFFLAGCKNLVGHF